MDTLPMTEDTKLEFASKKSGRMHSRGQDAHPTMLASAANILHGSVIVSRILFGLCFSLAKKDGAALRSF